MTWKLLIYGIQILMFVLAFWVFQRKKHLTFSFLIQQRKATIVLENQNRQVGDAFEVDHEGSCPGFHEAGSTRGGQTFLAVFWKSESEELELTFLGATGGLGGGDNNDMTSLSFAGSFFGDCSRDL